jgi:hypothetical protein
MPRQQVERRRRSITPALEQLAFEINTELEGVANGVRTTAKHAATAGELLLKAKDEELRHGNFGEWCRQNFQVTERTLQKYMELARYIRERANTNPTSDLDAILEMGIEAALRFLRWQQQTEAAVEADDEDDGDGEQDEAARAEDDNDGEEGDDEEDDVADPVRPTNTRTDQSWVRKGILDAESAASRAVMRGDWTRHADLITDELIAAKRRCALAWVANYKATKRLRRQPPLAPAAE